MCSLFVSNSMTGCKDKNVLHSHPTAWPWQMRVQEHHSGQKCASYQSPYSHWCRLLLFYRLAVVDEREGRRTARGFGGCRRGRVAQHVRLGADHPKGYTPNPKIICQPDFVPMDGEISPCTTENLDHNQLSTSLEHTSCRKPKIAMEATTATGEICSFNPILTFLMWIYIQWWLHDVISSWR